MSLEKLVQLGWYKTEPSSSKEIADLFSIVDRSQADLKVEGISDDLRFQAAYNGVLTLANIALRASGNGKRLEISIFQEIRFSRTRPSARVCHVLVSHPARKDRECVCMGKSIHRKSGL